MSEQDSVMDELMKKNAELFDVKAQRDELLDALQDAFDTWFEKPSNIEEVEPEWVVNARTAIDKAKGGDTMRSSA